MQEERSARFGELLIRLSKAQWDDPDHQEQELALNALRALMDEGITAEELRSGIALVQKLLRAIGDAQAKESHGREEHDAAKRTFG
jgi:uncharacterized protein YoaH (UPF0181 family)